MRSLQHLTAAILSFCLHAALAQPTIIMEEIEGPTPWTSTDFNDDPEEFQFAIVTDRTGGHRPGVFMEGIRKLNLLQPEFVMSVGDLIEGYTEDRAVLNTEWDEFEGFISHLEMPFFYVPGNHDLTNEVMGEIWAERFGKTHYHFVYKNVLFLCLDSEDLYRSAGRGSISDPQFEYAKQVLEQYPDVSHTLIFMHQPLWTQRDPKRWPDLEKELAQRPHTVFVGHNHNYVKFDRNNGQYFILATTGGGSNLRGPALGEFDHVVWVTMKKEGPVITNLMLNGIHDDNVMTAQKRQFLVQGWQRNPIEVQPLYVDEKGFEKGAVDFTFYNSRDLPMTIEVREGFAWDLLSSVDRNLLTLAPNTSATVSLELQNRNGLATTQLRALPVRFHLSFEPASLGRVEIPATFFVKPIVKRYLQARDGDIVIDGDLDDWHGVWSWHEDLASDNRVRWSICHDADFMYLAAQVEDDTVWVDPAHPSWKQDGFGWILALGDGDDLAVRSRAASFRATPAHGAVPQKIYRGERWPESLAYIARSNEQGYAVEARIPLEYLQEGDWSRARVNFFFDDRDGVDEPVRVHWQAPWRSPGAVLGSGMFFRSP